MMQTVGLLVEFEDGRVKTANFGMATAARGENRHLVALVVDASAVEAEKALGPFGVSCIVSIDTGTEPGKWDPAARTKAVVAAMEKFEITQLIGLTSQSGREVLPRIAARLDAPLVMDCIDIDIDGRRVKTSQYSGKTIATIVLTGKYFIYGLRANAVAPVPHSTRTEIVPFTFLPEPDDRYHVLETRSGNSGTRPLSEADIIISGGRGLENGENFNLLHDLASRLGAAVGASRVAVDNGWVPYTMQVGQTGAKVNPKVYIACGISGSIQHYAGMKTSGMIIAINSDPHAAIISNCDYFAVGDLFEILPQITVAIEAVKKAGINGE